MLRTACSTPAFAWLSRCCHPWSWASVADANAIAASRRSNSRSVAAASARSAFAAPLADPVMKLTYSQHSRSPP
jgi:hypothetical protein